MKTLTDLPADIIQLILRPNFCNLTDVLYTDRTLQKWKKLLSFLWVNSEWRSFAVPYLYGCVFAGALERRAKNPKGVDGYAESVLLSNIHLINQNGFQRYVKILNVLDCSDLEHTFTVHLVKELALCGASHVGPVLEGLFAGQNNIKDAISSASNDKLEELAEEVGALIMAMFPTVSNLQAHMPKPHAFQVCFSDKLVRGYGSQLSAAKYHSGDCYPNISAANNLTKLELHILLDNDIYEGVLLYPIDTHLLQSLRMESFTSIPPWEVFYLDQGSGVIQFPNLKKLVLDSDYTETIADDGFEQQINPYKLEFPKLEDLSISQFNLIGDDMRDLLQAPLKRLYYSGNADRLLKMCEHGIGGLSYLAIRDLSDFQSAETVLMLNKVFSYAQGITIVRCRVHIHGCIDIQHKANWPNLTYLNVVANMSMADMLAFASCTPDVEDLIYSWDMFDVPAATTATEILHNIRQHYSQPSISKIRTFTVMYSKDIQVDAFRSALENLKWYWPNLQNIKVQKDRGYC